MQVRELNLGDVDAASHVLACAFENDDGIRYLIEGSSKSDSIASWFGATLRMLLDTRQAAWCVEDAGRITGVALTSEPGFGPGLFTLLRWSIAVLRSVGAAAVVRTARQSRITDSLKEPDCLVIEFVGVSTHAQGHGLGSRLLDTVHEWAVDEGYYGIWLETTSRRNVPWYEHRGFELRQRLTLPGYETFSMTRRIS